MLLISNYIIIYYEFSVVYILKISIHLKVQTRYLPSITTDYMNYIIYSYYNL